MYWTSAQLKIQAKAQLRPKYWNCLAVTLLFSLVIGDASWGGSFFDILYRFFTNLYQEFFPRLVYSGPDFETVKEIRPFWPSVWVSLFIGLLLTILVRYNTTVGLNRWFSQNRETPYQPPFSTTFSTFNSRQYGKVLVTMLRRDIVISLWHLVFLVPGVIKNYQYYFVPWILADNPEMGYRRAMEICRGMTDGEKGALFYFDLSFLGWQLLGLLACCIGGIFVVPYYKSTQAELYALMRHKALSTGICTYEELGFYPPESISPANASN